MALKSGIRKIDLNANCDLSKYEQDIHDYEGFDHINSLFRNKRLINWRHKTIPSNEIISGITWRASGNKFVISSNDVDIMEIDNKGYKLETVEELPSSASLIENPKTTDDAFGIDGSFRDVNSLNYCHYEGKEFLFDKESRMISCYQNGVFTRNYSTAIPEGVKNVYLQYIPGFSSVTLNGITLTIPGTAILVYAPNLTNGNQYVSSFINNSTVNIVLIDQYGYGSLLTQNDVFTGDVTTTTSTNLSFVSGSGTSTTYLQVFPKYNSTNYVNFWIGNGVGYYDTNGQTSTGNNLYFSIDNPTLGDGNKRNFLLKQKNTAGGSTTSNTVFNLNECLERIWVEGSNYSQCLDNTLLFAINYVSGEAENIAHQYKKLYPLDNADAVYYDYVNKAVYVKEGDIYKKITIQTFNAPQYQMVGNYYLIFNTTSYLNALSYNGKTTVFCSCDDWNNRSSFGFASDNKEASIKQVASRVGNNWQTSKQIETVSSQYLSVAMWIPDDPTVVFFDNYTAPTETAYTLYCSTDSQTQSGDIVQRGYISVNFENYFKSEIDESNSWTDGIEEYQDNPPLLGTNYRQFANSYYVSSANSIYKLMTIGTASQYPFLMFLASETGYSSDAFTQFVINGQLYTYYPTTNIIVDSNDTWVCSTEFLLYVGYSTEYAFFYSTFDKNLYTFTGNNVMSKVSPFEKETLKLVEFVDGNGNLTLNASTVNIPSLSMTLFSFENKKLGVLLGDQFCLINTAEEVDSVIADIRGNCIRVNNEAFSLVEDVEGFSLIPIEFETEFYGNPGTNSLNINDCVYFTLVNMNGTEKGKLTIKAEALQNGKVIEIEEKTLTFTSQDFNKNQVLEVKFQPKVQDCFGFKLIVKSDFEIAELKIGTSASGTIEQTTHRL